MFRQYFCVLKQIKTKDQWFPQWNVSALAKEIKQGDEQEKELYFKGFLEEGVDISNAILSCYILVSSVSWGIWVTRSDKSTHSIPTITEELVILLDKIKTLQ